MIWLSTLRVSNSVGVLTEYKIDGLADKIVTYIKETIKTAGIFPEQIRVVSIDLPQILKVVEQKVLSVFPEDVLIASSCNEASRMLDKEGYTFGLNIQLDGEPLAVAIQVLKRPDYYFL